MSEGADGAPPLRLALFAEQGHPDVAFRSGVTRLTDKLVEGCRRHGVLLDYFTYHPDPGTDTDGCVRWHRAAPRLPLTVHGLTIDALDLLPLPNPGLHGPARERAYDVVLATSPGIGTQGQWLAREREIPFAAVYTTDLPHYAEALVGDPERGIPGAEALGRAARAATWRYVTWLYRAERTDLVLVPTEAARRAFMARVPARAQVLGRGSDTLRFPEAGPREAREQVRLLYVGRVDYGEKNLAVLEAVMDRLDDAVLRVVGDGDDLALMKDRFSDDVARGRVSFTGRVDDQERLASLYLSSDVFLFPSLYDTLGQVVIEAQRAGLPVVVRDRGGPKELVRDGETGFVTADDEAFVARAAELTADPALRARMGGAAKAHADAMPGWTEVVDDLLGRLRRLAGDGGPGSDGGSRPGRTKAEIP